MYESNIDNTTKPVIAELSGTRSFLGNHIVVFRIWEIDVKDVAGSTNMGVSGVEVL